MVTVMGNAVETAVSQTSLITALMIILHGETFDALLTQIILTGKSVSKQ
jgi:hypothetical protein